MRLECATLLRPGTVARRGVEGESVWHPSSVHETRGADPGVSSPGLLNPRLLSRTPPAFGGTGKSESAREMGNAFGVCDVAAAGDGRAPGRGVRVRLAPLQGA